jgi:hypothetical protein
MIPVFVKFARQLKLAGPVFESDINTLSSFYSKSGVTLGRKSALGYMIEPRLEKRSKKIKTSQSIPWRILENNYQIQVDEPDSSKIGKTGEIDLIVYANMNLYLIELKALRIDTQSST